MRHLLKTVGKKPTREEMTRINKQFIRPAFKKIYDNPDKPPALIRSIYDRTLSGIWDKLVADQSSFSEILLLKKYIKSGKYSRITSVASGLAVFELFLAKEFFPDGKILCVDISEGMNRRAEAYKKKLGAKNIDIITASATKLPIKRNSQDIVLIRRSGMSNDRRWNIVLKEARKVLKKKRNSRVIYTADADFTKPLVDIKTDLKRAKFKFVASERFRRGDGKLVEMIVAKCL